MTAAAALLLLLLLRLLATLSASWSEAACEGQGEGGTRSSPWWGEDLLFVLLLLRNIVGLLEARLLACCGGV
jgi:hypothetical protein